MYYEDLLTEPEEVLGKVWEFLGEDFDENTVHFEKSKDPHSKTPLLSRPIQKDNKEKWRRTMSPRQIRVFESLAWETLKRNGYPLTTAAGRLRYLVRAAYRTHERLMEWDSRGASAFDAFRKGFTTVSNNNAYSLDAPLTKRSRSRSQ